MSLLALSLAALEIVLLGIALFRILFLPGLACLEDAALVFLLIANGVVLGVGFIRGRLPAWIVTATVLGFGALMLLMPLVSTAIGLYLASQELQRGGSPSARHLEEGIRLTVLSTLIFGSAGVAAVGVGASALIAMLKGKQDVEFRAGA